MNNKDLFSVIILHYNQQNYLFEALDSVFIQDYDNIELIIADDASYELDIDRIQSYVEEHKKSQISSIKYQFLKENVGTVRNVNQALKLASGKYAMFFAADDCLYDSHVLTNYVNALSSLPSDQYMVCAQCVMMDEKMKKKLGNFVNVPLALSMNNCSSLEQYQRITFSCFYAMGATAFRMEMLKDRGYFDETYRIIEDWSYYLSLTLNGSKIIYSDFKALKHRDGGVSHFNNEVLPPHVIEYKNDSLLIQERLILPNLSYFPLADKEKLIKRYEHERKAFANLYINKVRPSRISIILRNKRLYLHKAVWWMMDRIFYLRDRCLHWAKYLFIVWATLCLLKILSNAYKIKDQIVFFNSQLYDIITNTTLVLLLVDIIICVCFILIYFIILLRRNKNIFFSKKR